MADVIMNWPTPNGMHKLTLDVPCPLNSTIFDCTAAIIYFNLTYQKKIIHFNLVVDEVPIFIIIFMDLILNLISVTLLIKKKNLKNATWLLRA